MTEQTYYITDISLLYCPLSHCIFLQPVLADDGNVYEKQMIKQWQLKNGTSPNTRQPISNRFTNCIPIKKLVDEFLIKYPELKNDQYILDVDELTFMNNLDNLKFLDDYKIISLYGFKQIQKILSCSEQFVMKLIDRVNLHVNISDNYNLSDYIFLYCKPNIIKYAIDKKCSLDYFCNIPQQYYFEIVEYIIDKSIDMKILFKTHDQCLKIFKYDNIIKILDKLDNVNIISITGFQYRLIEYACNIGSIETIKYLMGRGAELNTTHNVLKLLAKREFFKDILPFITTYMDIIRFDSLTEHELNTIFTTCEITKDFIIRVNNLNCCIRQICKWCSSDIIQYVINNTNLEHIDNNKRKMIHEICQYGSNHSIILVIDKSKDIDSKDAFGMKPIDYVCQRGFMDVIIYMIDKGINVKDMKFLSHIEDRAIKRDVQNYIVQKYNYRTFSILGFEFVM